MSSASRTITTKASASWIPQVRKRLAQQLAQGRAFEQEENKSSPPHTQTNAMNIYFSQERNEVVRQSPSFLLPSCWLPPGHIIATDSPTNILLHRDATTGQVQAYRNQCRHRGSPLVLSSTEPQPLSGSAALVCPYHSWTYDIRTGALKRIPQGKEAFPCLKKEDHGLFPLDCFELAGGIWIAGDEMRKRNLWSLKEVAAELSSFWRTPTTAAAPDNTIIGYHEWNSIDANWQLLVETFLESYHVQSLHQQTLGTVAHASPLMITDSLDTTSLRMTVPLKNFKTDDNNDELSFFSQTTTTYLLFPSTSFSIFKRFGMFLSIQPKNIEICSSSSRVRAWAIPLTSTSHEDTDLSRRDFDSVIRGIDEDWEMAQRIQLGLNIEEERVEFHYGSLERNNVAFLKNVQNLSKKIR